MMDSLLQLYKGSLAASCCVLAEMRVKSVSLILQE